MNSVILLVDDNRMILEIEKEFLQDTKTEVVLAHDGLEALSIANAKRPDMIFMDLEMPRMDGVSCCRAIKSDPTLAKIPVVMVTSRSSDADRDHCFSSGCDDFISKPLDRDAFLYVARKFIPGIDRRETRILVNIDAELQIKNEKVPCKLYDLSAGGAFLVTDYLGTLNSVVQISFSLGGSLIESHGRFSWINRTNSKYPHGIGIKFALMSKEMKAKLQEYIDRKR